MTVSMPVRSLAVEANGSVTDVTNYTSCRSTEDDVLKVSPDPPGVKETAFFYDKWICAQSVTVLSFARHVHRARGKSPLKPADRNKQTKLQTCINESTTCKSSCVCSFIIPFVCKRHDKHQ